MGKRRKSAKTIRSSKAGLPDAVSDNEDGDVIGSSLHGNEVDDYYDEQDHELSLKLGSRASASRNLEDINEVFGLSDSDDDFIDSHKKKKKKKQEKELGDDEFDAEDVEGSWGSKKKYFYGGNPNEKVKKSGGKVIEEDENELNEAEAEEKESRLLQEKQLQTLTDEDFLFDVYGASNKKKSSTKKSEKEDLENVKLDLSKLSRKEKVRLFERECPEFGLITEEFAARMKEIGQIYQPIVDLMQKGILPNEGSAAEYIKLKHQIAINYGVNMACYLMFKSRKVDLKMHPLTARLVQFKNLLDDLESKLDPIVSSQVQKILKLLDEDGGLKKLKKLTGKAKQEPVAKKPKSKKPKKTLKLLQKKAKGGEGMEPGLADQFNDFTPDEAMALEMMAGRKNKSAADSDDDEDYNDADAGEEEHLDDDVDDEKRRSITYEMSKNKGLMPKRSKLQRNPRVKHRVKYQKAKVRRKGQVREVRTEVKKYAGEMSGINKRVKKGIKLA